MVMLIPDNKTDDDYKEWASKIGEPSELGVHLQVGISYSDRQGPPHVLVEGIVGVPRRPEDDLERNMLATKLADLVDTPEIAVFQLTGLLWWRVMRGGPFGVELIRSQTLRDLDENEISNKIVFSGPGPMSEPAFRYKSAESRDWEREYRANRYLRFDRRAGLNQRYQDLITNITILTETGEVDLTEENRWHRLFRHVVSEMFLRGEPPVPHNFHPAVAKAVLFPDKELCEKAAEAVAKSPNPGPILVKYGKADHMTALYRHGIVHMPPASCYDDPEHNQAIHDQELAFSQYGVVATPDGFLKAHEIIADPDVFRTPEHHFLPIFQAPKANEDEVVRAETLGPDAWTYCMSTTLMPRLFSDFSADACVVVDRVRFVERVCKALRSLARCAPARKTLFAHAEVEYVDPFGAYAETPRPPQMHLAYANAKATRAEAKMFAPFGSGAELMRPQAVHWIKGLRFAYQREYRFVSYPPQQADRLDGPIELSLGSLDEISKLIVL